MSKKILTSPHNPRIKQAARLRDRRRRDREQLFLIEGYRELLRACENKYPVHSVFFCPPLFQGENENDLLSALQAGGTQLLEVSETVLRKIAYRDRPEGLVAVAPQVHRKLADLKMLETPLLLVAEAIEKPGNLGTMLRSTDATAADALLLCDSRTDLFNPNVVRASTGVLFSTPVVETSTESMLGWLAEHGIAMVAATPHAEKLYTEVDMRGPLALAVGTEQYGLSAPCLQQATWQVRIPMLGKADSLNVAAAATLLLYEAVRQRLA